MFRRRVDAALVSVYVRPEGSYVVSSARTAEGAWVHRGPVTVLTDAEATAREVSHRLAQRSRAVSHPSQDAWPRILQAGQQPLLGASGRTSWTGFVTGAALVQLHRDGGVVEVVRMRARKRPAGAFEPAGTERLTSPSDAEVEAATLRALS